MGRQRDPKRDKAFEIYKASNGTISLIDIAAKLGVGDGTLRGWKAKDRWENLLTGEIIEVDRFKAKERNAPKPEADENDGEQDELFLNAVLIVVEAQQAYVSMLQRRMRIGYTRSARLIDEMEKRGFVGPYSGSEPRKVLITEFYPDKKELVKTKKRERNAPKKLLERSDNMERSENIKNAPIKEPEPEQEEEENDGFTPRQRLFVKYYLINFNATQSAIKSGYSIKAAKEVGYRLLTYAHIKAAIKKYNEEISFEIGMNVQRTIMEYMKIAFSDITEFVEFGQKDEPLFTDEGPALDRQTGEQITYKRNFIAFRESTEIDGTLISEVKQGKDGVGIKLHDKMKALEVLTKYHDLLPDHHKRMVDQEKLKLDRERFEFEKVKSAGEGDLDEELIDDWVSGVMGDDETDGEHDQEDVGIQEEDTDIS